MPSVVPVNEQVVSQWLEERYCLLQPLVLAVGTAVLGILWLGESRDALKLVSIVLLVAGIIGLRPSERS